MSHYIEVLVDREGNGCPVVWYPDNGRPVSVRMETVTDAINLAKTLAKLLGIEKIYVEDTEAYLLHTTWAVTPGIRPPKPNTPHNLDVIAKGAP